MDEWVKEMFRDTGAVTGTFGVWDVLLGLLLSFFLSLSIIWTYKQTHRGLSYSVSFVHTVVIMSVTVSIIMLIIGSNLARAFALVGALSIIRFRTAIKDPRDVAFIFVAMAVGMACGVRLPLIAVIFTLFICPMIYFLHRFDIGSMPTSEVLLKVHLPENLDYHRAFDQVFYEHLRDHTMLSVETIQGGTLIEVVYSIHFKDGADQPRFLDALRAVNGNNKVTLLTGAQNVSI
jgi:uncharacterized membrane protein YhiD involved in acid resistance